MDVNKLEKAYFYNCSYRNVVADISWLTEKLYNERDTILICCKDQETVEVIDDFLWRYKEDGFIPHSTEKKERSSIYPVLITTDIDEEHKHNVLLALSGVLIEEKNWHKFTKAYYFLMIKKMGKKKTQRQCGEV